MVQSQKGLTKFEKSLGYLTKGADIRHSRFMRRRCRYEDQRKPALGENNGKSALEKKAAYYPEAYLATSYKKKK